MTAATPRHLIPVDREDRLLTTEEVAARLRIRKQWLYQRVHARTLPFAFLKVGAYLRFSERAVEDYIRRQQEQTAGEQRRGR